MITISLRWNLDLIITLGRAIQISAHTFVIHLLGGSCHESVMNAHRVGSHWRISG